jgi:hypothetical protein
MNLFIAHGCFFSYRDFVFVRQHLKEIEKLIRSDREDDSEAHCSEPKDGELEAPFIQMTTEGVHCIIHSATKF